MTTHRTRPAQAPPAGQRLSATSTSPRCDRKPANPPRRVIQRGVVEGPLFIALPHVSRSGHPLTEIFIQGQWISAWGHREDLLADMIQGAIVRVPWKRLEGLSGLYLDGDVTVLHHSRR